MGKFKLKKRSVGPQAPIELNITPMIDMFSVLIAFLILVAVFSATGFHKAEIPFLSEKPPPTREEIEKEKPHLTATVIIDKDYVVVEYGNSKTSLDIKPERYDLTEQGLDSMQDSLYRARTADPGFDLVTVMTELDVPYDTMMRVFDTMRVLQNNRPTIPLPQDYKVPDGVNREALIPKIVLGNVIL